MAKIIKTECKNQEEPFSSENSQPILKLEPLSDHESLVLNDIFDNCLGTDVDLKPDVETLNKSINCKGITTIINTEGSQSSVCNSEMITEPTVVQVTKEIQFEVRIKDEPKPEKVFIKQEIDSETDTASCATVDYSKTEICKFMESNSDSKMIVEPTLVQDAGCSVTKENQFEVRLKDEPKPEEMLIKEETDLKADIKCVSVDYTKTEVCKFMESDSDGEDNESSLQIDTSTKPMDPILNAYHSVRMSHCISCKLVFNKKAAFYDHVFKIHEEFFLRCTNTKQKVPLKQVRSHLREHIVNESLTNMPYEKAVQIVALKCEMSCNFCTLVFTSVLSLSPDRIQTHLLRHLKVPYQCERCERRFCARAPLMKHILCHQKNSCLDCDKVFKTTKELNRHLTYHQETPIICEVCGQKFLMKPLYNKHILNHATFECNKCNKKFLTSGKLKFHQPYCMQMMTHRGKRHKANKAEVNNSEYECMKCMKKFKTMVEYSLHSHL